MSNQNESDSQKSKLPLRIWMLMLTCNNVVIRLLRQRVRDEFGITMPVFDLLTQVHRPPEGPTLRELSDRLMVSKGNITELSDRLERKGLIQRVPDPNDGRAQRVFLTQAGRDLVERMEPAHQGWLDEIMAAQSTTTLEKLHQTLGSFKADLPTMNQRHRGRRSATSHEEE
ncbi:MarR family winged helix-turn-helix transcriptional regulator [Paramagnetospirillum caucaseum]|nr:MarR family transcriptional regulator [Paramagnetospirillum caucaseum]